MGDTLNVALRLEGANKYFGTTIMAAKSTFDRAPTIFHWRELDSIRVQGRDEPVSIYEPLAHHGEQTGNGRLRARFGLLAAPRFDRLHCRAHAGGRGRSALGPPLAAGQDISGASAGARLGRRQNF
jgi:hypothetical protein